MPNIVDENGRLDLRYQDGVIGPVVEEFLVTIGSDDYSLPGGFLAEVTTPATGGTCNYRTLFGSADQQRTGLDAGDQIGGVAGIPALLSVIRGTSTVTQIRVGVIGGSPR